MCVQCSGSCVGVWLSQFHLHEYITALRVLTDCIFYSCLSHGLMRHTDTNCSTFKERKDSDCDMNTNTCVKPIWGLPENP